MALCHSEKKRSGNELGLNCYGVREVQEKREGAKRNKTMIKIEDIIKNINFNIKKNFDIKVYKTITSTNTVLKEMASKGAPEWTVLIAEEQTEGRGRMNRKFYSPSETGIYMSIILRPYIEVSQALFITTMTAVAVSEAVDEVFEVNTGIKWVNDIYLNNRKICGILAESALYAGKPKLDYTVVGIGINVEMPNGSFPEEISGIAGSIIEEKRNCEKEENDIRNMLVAKILTKMYKYYNQMDKGTYMDIYRNKSILVGKEVYVLNDEAKEKLKVIDIDDSAALVVQHENGRIDKLSSGEVSVRLF